MERLSLLLILALLSPTQAAQPGDVEGSATTSGKAQANAVVWLDGPKGQRPVRQPPAVLEQRNVQFDPLVIAVQVGTIVKFPNSDRVFHNVFSFHDAKTFNLGLYPVGMVKDVPFDQPGLSRVFCNIHPQMGAYVMVLETSYFAVSDKTGRFVLRGVPPGVYRYHAWRPPSGAILTDTITVGSAAPFEVRWP